MENEESVHDFLDTKPYVDHWGGMSDQDFIDLARRIVVSFCFLHLPSPTWAWRYLFG